MAAVTDRSLERVTAFGMTITPFNLTKNQDGVAFSYYGGAGKRHPVGSEELGDLVMWLEQAMGV